MATDTLTAKTLIERLDALWAMDENIFPDRNDFGQVVLNINQNTDLAKKYPNESEVPYDCDGVLIDSSGNPDWSNIHILKEHGYRVFCTERDSFGWLGAAVAKGNRVLYFG